MKILPERVSGPDLDGSPCGSASMRRRQLRQILKIEQQVYPRPWSAAVFASEIDQIPRTRRYLVAHVGRRLVGYGGVLVAPDSAHVTNIAVDPGRQRQGIGSRLLLALAREAIAIECRAGAHPRGADQQRRRPGAVPDLRVRAGGCAQALLRGHATTPS